MHEKTVTAGIKNWVEKQKMWSDNTVFTEDKRIIKEFVSTRSVSMSEYLKKADAESKFFMWYKYLTHSDLTTRGKRTNSSDGFERNLLYYLSVEEMIALQNQFPDKVFESAKQSNIGMPEEFYLKTGIPRIQRRKGQQTSNHNWILFNDYLDVYLVNDTLYYFSMYYSEKTMNALGKEMPSRWKGAEIVLDKSKPFTDISLHEAIHGIGVEADTVFHSLRLTMFLNDTIIFICEKQKGSQNLFIMLEKNAQFYYVNGLRDKKWMDAERIRRYRERAMISEGVLPELSGQIYESEWDRVLMP